MCNDRVKSVLCKHDCPLIEMRTIRIISDRIECAAIYQLAVVHTESTFGLIHKNEALVFLLAGGSVINVRAFIAIR